MSEDEDPFVKEVLAHSKRVLLESKRLVDLVNNMVSEEEDISAPARDTALATFELLDYVTREIVTHRGKQREGLGGQALLAACKDVRSAVLDLVQAARSVFSNPFDFLSKQTLDNCRNSVVNSIKGVIQAAESLQQETTGNSNNNRNEKSGEAGNFDVVQDMKNANKALQAIFSCSRAPVPQDVFVQSAKGLLDTINQLMFISKSLNLSLEDRLKEDTTGVINAAKLILRDFEDKTFHARFQEATKVLQASLKTFLFACAKSKDGKVLDNSSTNLKGLRPRSEIMGAPRGMEADSHSFVLAPPRPASAPPPSLSPSPSPSLSSSPSPSPPTPSPPSYSNNTATAPVELMSRPSPLTKLNSTDLKSSIS